MIASLLSVTALILLAEPSRALLRSDADEQVAKANVRSRQSNILQRNACQVNAMASALASTPSWHMHASGKAHFLCAQLSRFFTIYACLWSCRKGRPVGPRVQSHVKRPHHIQHAHNSDASNLDGVACVGAGAAHAFHCLPSLRLQHVHAVSCPLSFQRSALNFNAATIPQT